MAIYVHALDCQCGICLPADVYNEGTGKVERVRAIDADAKTEQPTRCDHRVESQPCPACDDVNCPSNPLAERISQPAEGCTVGNCSQRPKPTHPQVTHNTSGNASKVVYDPLAAMVTEEELERRRRHWLRDVKPAMSMSEWEQIFAQARLALTLQSERDELENRVTELEAENEAHCAMIVKLGGDVKELEAELTAERTCIEREADRANRHIQALEAEIARLRDGIIALAEYHLSDWTSQVAFRQGNELLQLLEGRP